MAGIEAGRETSDPTRPTWTNVPTTSLLNPDPDQALRRERDAITSIVHTTAVTRRGLCARHHEARQALGSDGRHPLGPVRHRLHADRRAGGRVQPRRRDAELARGAWSTSRSPIGSIYFDAGTSFNPSAESLSLSASTANLPPEKNRTYEFGTKWDFPHSRLSLRAAVFRTDKAERPRARSQQFAAERSGRQPARQRRAD